MNDVGVCSCGDVVADHMDPSGNMVECQARDCYCMEYDNELESAISAADARYHAMKEDGL